MFAKSIDRLVEILGAKKRKMALSTTRHTSPTTTNITEMSSVPKPISADVPLVEEPVKSLVDEIPMEISHESVTCPVVVDDDDIMPVVASVEEEQLIIDETNPSTIETTFLIVESTDGNDERIRLDDVIPSSIVPSPSQETDDHENEEIQMTISTQSPSIPQKKSNRKRQRNGYVKSRSRGRSSTTRVLKKSRLMDEENNLDENNSLVMIITREKIEQHLRTLFMTTNDNKRTRTRPVKTPTRLVEEINPISMKTLESDSNVFDILSSSTPTDTGDQTELTENSPQSCIYNIVASTKSNKLGLTIKKVVPT